MSEVPLHREKREELKRFVDVYLENGKARTRIWL